MVSSSFNRENRDASRSIREDIAIGLRYVVQHPLLRLISVMMILVNFVNSTRNTQLVLFASDVLDATQSQIGILYSTGSLGVVILSLLAGKLRERWVFGRIALSALLAQGLATVALAFTHWYWAALPLWALITGLGVLFNINTNSMRQSIVPNHMLGRVASISMVAAWSAIPIGSTLGGIAIEKTQSVTLVYGVIGLLASLIAISFAFTQLGRTHPQP